jgi:hypothetical protein
VAGVATAGVSGAMGAHTYSAAQLFLKKTALVLCLSIKNML